jgi:hypothetical protein
VYLEQSDSTRRKLSSDSLSVVEFFDNEADYRKRVDSIQCRRQRQYREWHPMHCNHADHKRQETVDGQLTEPLVLGESSTTSESAVLSRSEEAIPRRPSLKSMKLRRIPSAASSLLAGIHRHAKSLKLFQQA